MSALLAGTGLRADLHVTVLGSGSPVTVFAHGLGGSSAETRPLARRVPGTRLLVDFRGHGASGPLPDSGWDYDLLADDLLAVADEAGATQAVGLSLGAGTLLRVLSRQPDRFARLALVLPAAIDRTRADGASLRLRSLAAAIDRGDVDAVEDLLLTEVPAEGRARRGVRLLLRRRAEQLVQRPSPRPTADDRPLTDRGVLRCVPCPVLVVGQEGDALHPVDLAEELAALLPGGRLTRVGPGGVFWTEARTVQTALADSLTPAVDRTETPMSVLSPDRPALSEHMTAALEGAVDRHFAVAREWFPHEHVPWSEARDFAELPWEEAQSRLDPAVRASVVLNLLTEDNLPGYATELDRLLGSRGEAWRTWLHRWTAEEGRHSIALRDYLTVTRAVDPVQLERDRMATVMVGFAAEEKDALRTVAYVSLQELATRVAHRGTGKLSSDPGLDKLLARISLDENLHMLLYRDLFTAALEADPAAALEALVAEVVGFAMPGTGIPGFVRKAAVVARAGIYDLQIHRDEVVKPLLRAWRVFELENLPAAAEQQREVLVQVLDELDRRVERAANRRPARVPA